MTKKDASSPINTIPLPHHVHSHIHGWLQTKPDLSPTHPMEVTLDRQAYAELCVPLPRLYHNRHRPGKHSNNPQSWTLVLSSLWDPSSYSITLV